MTQMFFCDLLAFSMIQWMLAIWSLVPLPFLNPACTSISSQFTYCWGLAWRILSVSLLAYEMNTIVQSFEHCLAVPFFGIGMKTELFQSCGHCWVSQIHWHIECSTFTASPFMIRNCSTGNPSPPLALSVVILPKAYLTTHSRMSGSRWVITPPRLSRSLRSFLYNSSVYSCHFLLVSSTSIRSIPFLSFIVTIFAWNVPLVSLIFLKRSLDFPILLFFSVFCTDHRGRLSYRSLLFFGTLHSNQYIFSILVCLLLLFYSQLFVRPPQTTILPFCISFPWGWSWSLPPVQCHKPPSIALQALCLSDLIPWTYLSF